MSQGIYTFLISKKVLTWGLVKFSSLRAKLVKANGPMWVILRMNRSQPGCCVLYHNRTKTLRREHRHSAVWRWMELKILRAKRTIEILHHVWGNHDCCGTCSFRNSLCLYYIGDSSYKMLQVSLHFYSFQPFLITMLHKTKWTEWKWLNSQSSR